MHYILVQLPNLSSRLVALYVNNNVEYKQVFSLCKTLFRVDFSSSDAVVWGRGFFLSFWHLCCLFSGFVCVLYTNPLGRVPGARNKPMASDVTMFLLERVGLFIEPKSSPLPSYNYTNHTKYGCLHRWNWAGKETIM